MSTAKKKWRSLSQLIAALWVLASAATVGAMERPLIWPLPQKMDVLSTPFALDESVAILVPADRPAADVALARALVAELSDRYGLALKVEAVASVPAGRRYILLGSTANPLVQAQCASRKLQPTTAAESYRLHVNADSILVAGADDMGASHGLQSLRQIIARESGRTLARGVSVEDWPHLPFRAIRLYLPGPENIAFFKRFLRDFVALYKFNKVLMEVNASMRLDRHPELNAGWIDFAKDLYYTQRYNPRGPNQTSQNSAHHDTADGEILEKEQVADLVAYARRLQIEIIPEIPTFTHSYYLLTRHKHLAAIPDAEWPDTYMPTKPEVYDLVFDVMDEYIEVMKPTMIHIGHDEMFFPIEAVRGNEGKSMQELFAYDVQRIHAYLTAKGIKVAMYGDHLIEGVRGTGTKPMRSSTGWNYNIPGALTPEQVRDLIPKDILIFNWFWIDSRAAEGRGEPNDIKLQDFGFQWSYMNFTPFIENWPRRSVRPSVVGGSPAHWSATAEFPIGKDMMVSLLGTVNLMWSTHWPDLKELHRNVQSMLPGIRRNLRGRSFPSEDGDPTTPLNLTPHLSTGNFGVDLSGLKPGTIASRGKQFLVPAGGAVLAATASSENNPKPRTAGPIPVGADVSSIVFLHATSGPAANDMSYRYIHNFPDTSDLLGWYEVVYQDGFVDTVPIRYGVNILPLGWGAQPDIVAKGNAKEWSYAYEAEVVENGPHTLFAYEWVNPRFGKPVKEIRLHGTLGFVDTRGKPTPDNVIVLAGVSVVKKRPVPSASGSSGTR